MINREAYRPLINAGVPLVNTKAYASIEHAPPGLAWRAVLVYHLPAEVNRGGHAIHVGALTTGGGWSRTEDLRVGWTWKGRGVHERADPKPFEKQPPEPGAVVDLWMGQVTSVWIEDRQHVLSDKVHGLHSSVEDGDQYNTLGHNSFIVFFQMMTRFAMPIIITPTPPILPVSMEARLTAAEAELASLRAIVYAMQGD